MKDSGLASTPFEPGALAPTGTIPLSVPEINGNEWEYVKECLDSNWVSSAGPFVERFEQMVADYVGTQHAVATVNGTAALHLALLVAGVQPDDEVLVPALTFIAPANAVRYAGAWPVFIDAEPAYWQMDAEKVMNFLEHRCAWANGELRNKNTGRRVRGILPVHILGHPCDMDPIVDLARKFRLVVIEDATESLGALYKERMVGHLGDVACFSFNGNKVITTGGGGMIVTDNEAWAERARYLSTQAKDNPIEYIHNEIGYNYRLTNIQAALGCAQMERLASFIEKKRSIAAQYQELLRSVSGITSMPEAGWARSIFWMYTVLVDESPHGNGSRSLLHRLAGHDIQTRPLWQPLHRSAAYTNAEVYGGDVADALNRSALSLPCSVGLPDVDIRTVAEAIKLIQGVR
ncbi:MAG: perosamine synthetase [Blastocatellia bacterium]|jgi:perosamine synthetase|nr:perosamine synthetase [Blastocatellia bacterium]